MSTGTTTAANVNVYADGINRNWLLRSDLEPVTLTPETFPGEDDPRPAIEGILAKARGLNWKERQASQTFGQQTVEQIVETNGAQVRWPTGEASEVYGEDGYQPANGDRITQADGTRWLVVHIDVESFGGIVTKFLFYVREMKGEQS